MTHELTHGLAYPCMPHASPRVSTCVDHCSPDETHRKHEWTMRSSSVDHVVHRALQVHAWATRPRVCMPRPGPLLLGLVYS